MKIDAHQHFWRYDEKRDTWITPEMAVLKRDFLPDELCAELQANGIDACVAVQARQSEDETHFLLELADRFPAIGGVVGWVDLRADNLRERLEYFAQFRKLRGFRHIVQSETDDRFLLQREFLRGIGMLEEFGFTYDILIYSRHLPAAIEFVEKFPGQNFALDHLAKPEIKSGEIKEWATQVKPLARAPNVWCKLSGLITEADWKRWQTEAIRPYLDVVLECFGTKRLMFGSDWPVCLLAGSYRQVKQMIEDYLADLSECERELVFGANACRFYGLEVAVDGSAA
jgi:L-fuconolactonase